jgi:hypothetical protein
VTPNAGLAPHSTRYTSIYYIRRGWNTLANTDFHCVNTQHNTTKFNTVQKPCLSSDISPNIYDKLQPTSQRTHTLYVRQGLTDRHGLHTAHSIVLLKRCSNHEYGPTTNVIRHGTYQMSSKSSSSYGPETCRMDGRTDRQTARLTLPPHCISFLHILRMHNSVWFRASFTLLMRTSLYWDVTQQWLVLCAVSDILGQPINSIFKGCDQQVVLKCC